MSKGKLAGVPGSSELQIIQYLKGKKFTHHWEMYIKHITPVLKKITAIIWVEKIFMAHKANPNSSGFG